MMVFKCAADVVVKATRRVDDDTEYTTLQYLESHKPAIPAPRPLGYVRMSGITLIFQTYEPSTTLATVWSQLDSRQKASIRDQLDAIMVDLRSIPYTVGSTLGGVAGEGCKDIRRHMRQSGKPIRTLSEFEEFLFSSPHPGGQVFVDLLRQLYPHQSEEMKIVFTHGDLRPDNIAVDMDDCNQWVVTGLLDWEYSGFYPEYCEAFKCTNCIAPYEEDDWYLFLPDCISPKRYAHWWLLDRVREARVV
jgi:aminoglycoside phosphotransferase (APT) family kinase protein